MRVAWLLVGMVGCVGTTEMVDETEVECESALWAAYDSPPIAAEGATAPFTMPELLAAPLPATGTDRTIDTIVYGISPGWGCDEPHMTEVWVGDAPTAPPSLGVMGSDGAASIGAGFALRHAKLKEPMHIPAGEVPWLAIGILGAECGAKASGPNNGAKRWREDTGWTEIDGRLVVGAVGCAY